MGKELSKTLLNMFPDIEPLVRNLVLPTKDLDPF